MGRILFTAKAEPAKAEPAIDWSEIELRLPKIPAGAALAPEASATPANDPSLANNPPPANDPPATLGQSVSVGGDLLNEAGTTGTSSITDGNGSNIIVGDAGNDTITAGNGRLLLKCLPNRLPRSIAFGPLLTNI